MRMNYWFWLLLILPLLFVFSAKPESHSWWRMSRLLLAVIVPCGIIILVATFQYKAGINANEAFFEQFPHCRDTYCTNQPIGTRTGRFFGVLTLSWLPALSMTGLYEIIWRIFYFRRMRILKYTFTDNFLSTTIIFLGLLVGYVNYAMRYFWLHGFLIP